MSSALFKNKSSLNLPLLFPYFRPNYPNFSLSHLILRSFKTPLWVSSLYRSANLTFVPLFCTFYRPLLCSNSERLLVGGRNDTVCYGSAVNGALYHVIVGVCAPTFRLDASVASQMLTLDRSKRFHPSLHVRPYRGSFVENYMWTKYLMALLVYGFTLWTVIMVVN